MHVQQLRHDRFRRLDRDRWDVIIVGAGLGGLVAGGLLARRGSSVLVVDQHYVAGGNATVFRRRSYEFDVGIHYVGEAGPDGTLRRVLDAAGGEDVEFAPLDPDGFDTLVFPDFTFRVPAGVERYRDRLVEHFPEERAGIDRYLRLLREVEALHRAVANPRRLLPALLGARLALRYANGTLGRFLDTCTRSPELRAVLAGESGDYGQPPSRASLALHAGLMTHYLSTGAYYPVGGGQVLADRLGAAIEDAGGKLLLRTRAERILIRDGRAVGVELTNKHFGRRIVHAGQVIAAGDLKKTVFELVGPEHLRRRTSERVRRYEMSPALAVLYLGVRAGALGGRLANTNYWAFPDYDQERLYADVRRGAFSEAPLAYLSLASLKDPRNPRLAPAGVVNLQAMTLAPSAPGAWGVSDAEVASGAYSDDASYLARKAELARRLLSAAERALPGLSEQVVFSELATPLTHSRYTLSTGGTSYGIALTPSQFLHRRPGARTEIRGLVLAGASLRTGHGVMGAMMSGVFAAAEIAGKSVLAEVLGRRAPRAGSRRTGPPAQPRKPSSSAVDSAGSSVVKSWPAPGRSSSRAPGMARAR
ncbi:MAG: NAD(P)/FAD-dependent oxidoreductase [Sorangiineae bacterium]|nr:NAD(P)/FAD-dependent oxidoreductase [Polyangiaceae bacterium]MEB2323530.1 NAD(P)/FAD-dependent oxidoreductase [Sorangiineae bacterium]